VYSLLRFLLMVLVSMAVWMAIGLGVGCLLHWLVPAIDLSMATFIGGVTLGGCFLWLSRISSRFPPKKCLKRSGSPSLQGST